MSRYLSLVHYLSENSLKRLTYFRRSSELVKKRLAGLLYIGERQVEAASESQNNTYHVVLHQQFLYLKIGDKITYILFEKNCIEVASLYSYICRGSVVEQKRFCVQSRVIFSTVVLGQKFCPQPVLTPLNCSGRKCENLLHH